MHTVSVAHIRYAAFCAFSASVFLHCKCMVSCFPRTGMMQTCIIAHILMAARVLCAVLLRARCKKQGSAKLMPAMYSLPASASPLATALFLV